MFQSLYSAELSPLVDNPKKVSRTGVSGPPLKDPKQEKLEDYILIAKFPGYYIPSDRI